MYTHDHPPTHPSHNSQSERTISFTLARHRPVLRITTVSKSSDDVNKRVSEREVCVATLTHTHTHTHTHAAAHDENVLTQINRQLDEYSYRIRPIIYIYIEFVVGIRPL